MTETYDRMELVEKLIELEKTATAEREEEIKSLAIKNELLLKKYNSDRENVDWYGYAGYVPHELESNNQEIYAMRNEIIGIHRVLTHLIWELRTGKF